MAAAECKFPGKVQKKGPGQTGPNTANTNMTCRSPLKQYLTQTGWSLNVSEAYGSRIYRNLACGVCRDCRVRKARDWTIRSYHESQMHERNCVVTLTYAENPISLRREDTQVFFKAMRKRGLKFRYFGCGEYGEKLSRPHWHIILFGLDFPDKYLWKDTGKSRQYRSPTLEKYWPHGHATIGNFSNKAALYTAGYVQKKINGKMAADHYVDKETGEVLKPEMTLASLKPAIGFEWIRHHWEEVYPHDFVVIDGKERSVPAYYDRWLEKYRPHIWEAVREKRREYAVRQVVLDEEREAQAAKARDLNYKRLRRNLENQNALGEKS